MHPDPALLVTFDDATAGGSFTSMLPMLAAMGLIFYFVLYRPQKQEAETQAKLVASLQKGDRVVTTSGIHGRIHEAKGDTLVLELSVNNYMTVDRDAVRRKVEDPAKADAAKTDAAKGA
jgi:preprotein translocase subunit YajC